MSDTRNRLTTDMKSCLKSGEKDRLKVIRMLITEVKNAEINDPKEPGRPRSEEEVIQLISAYHKLLSKSLEEYPEDRREPIRAELAIVEGYLPRQLNAEEVEAALRKLLEGTEERQFGVLMKEAQKQLKGQAPGQLVAASLKKLMAES